MLDVSYALCIEHLTAFSTFRLIQVHFVPCVLVPLACGLELCGSAFAAVHVVGWTGGQHLWFRFVGGGAELACSLLHE